LGGRTNEKREGEGESETNYQEMCNRITTQRLPKQERMEWEGRGYIREGERVEGESSLVSSS